MKLWPWSWLAHVAHDGEVHTGPIVFDEPRTVQAEDMGGRLVVVTVSGVEAVLTVAPWERPRVAVKAVIAASTVAVGAFPSGTTTNVPRWRSYVPNR